ADYGGNLIGSTPAQRNAAYFVAEERISNLVNSPVSIATITGTYFYPHTGGRVQLDWMYLQTVHEIRFIDGGGNTYHTIAGTANYHAAIRDQERSIIDIFHIYGNCQGCGNSSSPYQFQIVYEAGLPTGTSTSPNFILALTSAAKLVTNEIIGYGNESVGGVGIEAFKNQDYFEKRTAMANTVLGKSTTAQWISMLLGGVRRRVGLGF
ncbi:MAG: hypothetical protein ACXADH_18930, partial [Candidatus Kariarchaeaceae archaeon]